MMIMMMMMMRFFRLVFSGYLIFSKSGVTT
jgi:hypothetical protein